MTADERLEALLNRAGQTISDLPSPIDYTIEQEELAMEAAADFGGGLEAYILHLTDIIDRMETALENVIGEQDYLVWALKKDYPCDICIHRNKYRFEKPCDICERANSKFEFAGVPEDWWVDDERPANA